MKGNKLYHGYSEHEIFKNEEDKLRILSMKEVEKEKIIAERVEKLNHKKEIEELNKLVKDKNDKINENKKNKINDDDNYSIESEESGEIKNDDKNYSKRKKTNNSDDNESSISMSYGDDKQIKKEAPSITIEELEKIRLNRDFFIKYYNYPIFDDYVKGAFIRVNLSSMGIKNMNDDFSGYSIGAIDKIIIDDSKPYNFMGNRCNKYVKLLLTELNFDFKVISNSKILDIDLKRWLNEKQKIPTSEEIQKIQQNIETIMKYELKTEELNNILNQKKKDRITYKDSTLNVTKELDLTIEKYRYYKEKYEEEKEREKREKEKGKKEKEKEKENAKNKKNKKADKNEDDDYEEEEEGEENEKVKEKEKEKENLKEKYYKAMKELEEDIKLLEKMKEERDKKAKINSENDIVAKINEDIRKKQKLDEKKSLLSKKRKKERNDKEHKVFKRVDCHPTTLFDSREIIYEDKKNEEEKEIKREKSIKEKINKKKKNNNNFCYAQKIKQLKNFITEKKYLIDEMMEYEKKKKNEGENELKEKENNHKKNEKDIDMSLFFKLGSINYEVFNKNIKEQNKKNTIDPQVKIIGLNEYLKEYNKE